MSREPDAIRISKTIAFLLRHRPDVGGLELDPDGWVGIDALARAVSKLLRFSVGADRVRQLVSEGISRRFQIEDDRIRAMDRSHGNPSTHTPDICYHACTEKQRLGYLERGHLSAPRGRSVFLSSDESQSWRAAHRMGGSPRVLYVDTSRARRNGVRFFRNKRNGLYMADSIPVQDVLNLRPNYAEQLSAGGIPVQLGDDGTPRLALIQVSRRSGTTWEVAKGKLDPGEPPEVAAVREVREEMGIERSLEIWCKVGVIRYGFMAPGALPRLKTVFLYLMKLDRPIEAAFDPAHAEGIDAVRWFTPSEAVRAVRHSSLIPLMKKARQLVEQRRLDAGTDVR